MRIDGSAASASVTNAAPPHGVDRGQCYRVDVTWQGGATETYTVQMNPNGGKTFDAYH